MKSILYWILSRLFSEKAFLLLLSMILLVYALTFTSFLPFQDEIDDYLNFVSNYLNEVPSNFMSLYEESFRTIHNVFLHKLVYLIQYRSLGNLDFRLLLLVGVGCYLVFLYLLVSRVLRSFPSTQVLVPSLILYLPIYKFTNWGMVAFIQGVLFLLTFVASHLLLKSSRRSTIGLAFILFFSITLGTGIIVVVIVLILSIVLWRRISSAKIGVIFTSLMYSIIIYQLKSSSENEPSKIVDYIIYIKEWFMYVFASYGSVLQYFISSDYHYYCIYFGVIILALFLGCVYHYLRSNSWDPTLLGLFIFLILVPLAGAMHRSFYGFRYALLEKFLMYPTIMIFFILVYSPNLISTEYRRIFVFSLAPIVASVVYFGFIHNHSKIINHQKALESGFVSVILNSDIEWLYRNDDHGKRFRNRMAKAIDLDLFKIREFGMEFSSVNNLNLESNRSLPIKLEIAVEDHYLILSGKNYMKPLPSSDDIDYFLTFQHKSRTYCFKLREFGRSLYGILDLDRFPRDYIHNELFLTILKDGLIKSYKTEYSIIDESEYNLQETK